MNFRYILIISCALIGLSMTTDTLDNCEPYFPISKGTIWVYNEFDKKGELSGTSTTEVIDQRTEGEKLIFQVKGIHDGPKKKEKNHYENEFEYICENGVFKINMENMIPPGTLDGFEGNATIDVTQTEMEFPKSIAAGDQLKDASVDVAVKMNGITAMNIHVNVTNRKCETIEDVTTPSGTYSCALISYTVSSKIGFVNTTSTVKDWYSTEVGIVKSESYNKNGSLESSRELISYTAGK